MEVGQEGWGGVDVEPLGVCSTLGAWPANGWGSFSGWCMHALHTTAVTCVCVCVEGGCSSG